MIEQMDIAYHLAMKAKREMETVGKVLTACPKCNEIIGVKIEGPYGERITVRCKCGFVSQLELGL